MLVLNSSPYELIKKGLLSLPVTRPSLNIPDFLMNLCNVEQLTQPLITFQVVLPVGHNLNPCRLWAKQEVCMNHMCVIMECEHDEEIFAERRKCNIGLLERRKEKLLSVSDV